MRAQVLAPDVLERTCASCHAPGSRGESYPNDARGIVADVNGTRADLDHLEAGVARVSDPARRERLMTLQMRATAAILDAAEALHAFDLPRARTRALEARARADEAVRAINGRGSR
jgi:hypothetical protein